MGACDQRISTPRVRKAHDTRLVGGAARRQGAKREARHSHAYKAVIISWLSASRAKILGALRQE
jgi:hypothetical protein